MGTDAGAAYTVSNGGNQTPCGSDTTPGGREQVTGRPQQDDHYRFIVILAL